MPEFSEDLAFAHRLADAADAVSMAHFRSEDLRTSTKDDGTPVSQVDHDVEAAMLSLVRRERSGDSVIGEEVGPVQAVQAVDAVHAVQAVDAVQAVHAVQAVRRWIFDGIDGTHNYAIGRVGWGTSIALEVDGEIVVGLISSPAMGKRTWAEKSAGSWARTVDETEPRKLLCAQTNALADAKVLVTPPEGFLHGWRNDVARSLTPPLTPRSQCICLDALLVATGELDALILIYGALWDFAAIGLIAAEAGATFADGWGGTRLDTFTAVLANPALIDQVIAHIAPMRPPEPDYPQLASKVTVPVHGLSDDAATDEWMHFGLRPLPSMSARVHVTNAPPMILDIVDEREACLAEPFVGVTTDGIVRAVPRSLIDDERVGTQPITDAATRLLGALTMSQRERVCFAMDAIEWRMWINVHMNHFRHGLLLEELEPRQRELALDIVRSTLSSHGFEQARSIMRLNELLAVVTNDHEAFGEWPYFLSIFGMPGTSVPWGWQIDGHHLVVNATVFDGRVVLTPSFMGAEPRAVLHGPLAGTSLFEAEESRGLDLMRLLDPDQRAKALLHPSIRTTDIGPHLQNLFDGRMQGGAFHDNLVAPYQGIAGRDLTREQRRALVALGAAYTNWSAPGHDRVRLREFERYLDETWFSWYGGFDDVAPFYYRVHSPAVLIEFDHHPGIAFANDEPTRHHVHTVVRTPNGGDYGVDLLRQHYGEFAHVGGNHVVRTAAVPNGL